LFQHGSQGKKIRLPIQLLGANLLRRHVGGGPHHGSCGGQVGRLDRGWLDVAMDDSLAGRGVERVGDLDA
jgi:hypothetical protein